MRGVCVYCGSSPGRGGVYKEAAAAMGSALAGRGLTLIYGGARVGLMGALADAALAAGGRVVGVIPSLLGEREVAHEHLDELIYTESMHERKTRMAERADAFVAMPGGLGTLEEFFEVLTWSQLGLHHKPVGLLNSAGYYETLLAFLDHCVAEELVAPRHRALIRVAPDPDTLLDQLAAGAPATG